LNRGDKVVYTYFYRPFEIGCGIGYYLFPLNKEQHTEPYHLVTSNQSLVEKVVGYEFYLSMVRDTINEKEVFYVYEYNIRPFSKALAKKAEQTYSFFESHKNQLELLFPHQIRNAVVRKRLRDVVVEIASDGLLSAMPTT